MYVRHLGHLQHVAYDDLQAEFEEEARQMGASSEEERIKKLRETNKWNDAKETDIARQKDAIARFEDAKKTVSIPSMLRQYESQIREEKERLGKMLMEKAELIGMTTEIYAERKLNDYYILTNLFSDIELTKTAFNEDQLDDMEDEDVNAIFTAYHAAISVCADANLRKLAVADFYTSYYMLCQDNLQSFFGRPVSEFTYYQVRLGNISRYFKTILEQTDLSQIDHKVRGDPDAIERLYTTQRNAAAAQAEGKPPTGLTSSDIKELGMQGKFTKLPSKPMSGLELVNHMMSQHRSS